MRPPSSGSRGLVGLVQDVCREVTDLAARVRWTREAATKGHVDLQGALLASSQALAGGSTMFCCLRCSFTRFHYAKFQEVLGVVAGCGSTSST